MLFLGRLEKELQQHTVIQRQSDFWIQRVQNISTNELDLKIQDLPTKWIEPESVNQPDYSKPI